MKMCYTLDIGVSDLIDQSFIRESPMDIVIKKSETKEEIRGKTFVHWKTWHEAYPGMIVGIQESKNGTARTHTVEILDFGGQEKEYWQLLYDRVPTLPQSLHRDFGVLFQLWQNIAHRVARTGKR